MQQTAGFILMAWFLTSCQTGLMNMSSSEENSLPVASRPIGKTDNNQGKLYLKEERVAIAPDPSEESGSLFRHDDKSSYLYSSANRGVAGEFIDVHIAWNSDASPEKVTDAKSKDAAEPAKEGEDKVGDAEQKILSSLPKLDQPDAKKLISKTVKMQVLGRRLNGDLDVGVMRTTQTEAETHTISVRAILPREKAVSGENVTTNDLVAIEWNENAAGESIVRNSTAWLDEYSLRFSGLSEARSREALALEEKRNQMLGSRKQLENELKALGKQRNDLAAARTETEKNRQESGSAVEALTKEVEDAKNTIAQQREELDKLTNTVTDDKKEAADEKKK
jgi:hypothetical protein